MKYRYKFPVEIEFEPVQLCNAQCFSCPYTIFSNDKEYTSKVMSRENIKKLLIEFLEGNKKFNKNKQPLITPFRYSDPLITKDLDLIFKLASDYDALVQITTNAKGFNEKNIKILDKYYNQIQSISISILGDTEKNVEKYMGTVSLKKTISTLEQLTKYKNIVNKIEVSLRIIDNTQLELINLQKLQKQFAQINIKSKIKKDWMANRNDKNFNNSGCIADINEKQYVVGCNLYDDKILKRIEVMVNGDVVLCCDDAMGKLSFGNIFKNSINEIWNKELLEYTKTIYSNKYSSKKKDLKLCNNCSRAIFNTTHIKKNFIKDTIKKISNIFSNNFNKIN